MPRSKFNFSADFTGAHFVTGTLQGMSETIETDAYIGSAVKYIHGELANEFDLALSRMAAMAPDQFHHVFEWNMVGNPSPAARLWRHQLRGRGRNRGASFYFLPSKTPVPVPARLAEPGPTGRRVKEGVHVFVWKAPIMEYGLTVTIRPKHAEALAFEVTEGQEFYTWDEQRRSQRGIAFVRHPVRSTPGKEVQGNFTTFFATWWGAEAERIFAQKMQEGMEKDLASVETLFRGKTTIAKQFNVTSVVNRAAFQRARRAAKQHFKGMQGKYDRQAAIRRRRLYGA